MGTMEIAVRGPVDRRKSGTLDYPDRYKQKLKSFREGTRGQALRDLKLNKEWGKIREYIQAIEGKMWPRERPSYWSKYVDNQMSRARRETLAQYTDIRPAVEVHGPEGMDKTATALKQLLIHQWIKNRFNMSLIQVMDHGLLSTGYWKINGALAKISTIACGMDTVLPVNNPGDIQESSAVDYRTYKPISYFASKWGREVAEKVMKSSETYQQPAESNYDPQLMMTEYSYRRLSPSMRHMMRDRISQYSQSREEEIFPVGELEEIWVEDFSVNEEKFDVIVRDPNIPLAEHNYWYRVKPGQRLYPRKRLFVWGGDEILYDSTSPFWYTGYPFAQLSLDPVVWAPGGISKYRTLLPLNQGYNEIHAGAFDTVKKAINQVYVAKRGSVSPADWDRFFPAIPGQRLLLNNTADIRDVRALDPPNLPAYVFEVARAILQSFDRHAGSINTAALSGKKQVPGGDVWEQMREVQAAPIRLEGKYIEDFLSESAAIGLSHAVQFFPRKYRYRILGNDGVTWDDYTWDPTNMVPAEYAKETFWQLFSCLITPGSLLGQSRERDQVKALTLFNAGALSLETLLRKADIGDVAAEINRIRQEHESGILPERKGKTPRLTRGQRTGKIA